MKIYACHSVASIENVSKKLNVHIQFDDLTDKNVCSDNRIETLRELRMSE